MVQQVNKIKMNAEITKLKKEELKSELKYLQDKRNVSLNMFNKAIKENNSFETIARRYETLIKYQKQWVLMEDALIVYCLKNHIRK